MGKHRSIEELTRAELKDLRDENKVLKEQLKQRDQRIKAWLIHLDEKLTRLKDHLGVVGSR